MGNIQLSTIGALSKLATATSTDSGVVATLTEANLRLARKLEDRSNELKEVNTLHVCFRNPITE
jgi:hypothetical protein